jgi:hypothetical protein
MPSARRHAWPALAGVTRERDGIAAHRLFPAMLEDRRGEKVATFGGRHRRRPGRRGELNQRVGDAEAVVDDHGWLPSERRELAWT